MVDSVEEVREAVFSHFGNKFVDLDVDRPFLEGIDFKSISEEVARDLEKPFLESEIRGAIWCCGGEKSLGSDGYIFLFIKNCWSFHKEDLVDFFKYFYSGNVISKAITSFFFTLVPKIQNPLSLDDYRPNCLVGRLYKVVAKLLSGRLKGVLDSIISPCQNSFVPRRKFLDGVLVAN